MPHRPGRDGPGPADHTDLRSMTAERRLSAGWTVGRKSLPCHLARV